MSEPGYWILRCQHRLLMTSENSGQRLFPAGSASDFGNPDKVLRVGEWEGLPCYAADLTQLPEIPFWRGDTGACHLPDRRR
jgi:NAD+ diphosphatase